MQFAEALVWKRILGKLPRTNIGKLSGPTWRRSFEIFNAYTLPASEYALRAWKDAAYSTAEQVPDPAKPGQMKTKKKSIQPLSKRIGPEYIASAHVLACSAAGLDGLECLQLVVDVLSSPLPADGSAEIVLTGELANIVYGTPAVNGIPATDGIPALQNLVKLFNGIERNASGSHVGGSALADSKWIWLMRTLKCLIADLPDAAILENDTVLIGYDHIADPIRDAKTNAESSESSWALGGLDYRPAPDELVTYPHALGSLTEFLAKYPEPDIYGDEPEVEPEVEPEAELEADDPTSGESDSILDSLLDD